MTRVLSIAAPLGACAMLCGCCRTYHVHSDGLPLDASGQQVEGAYRLCDQIEVVSQSLTWRTRSGHRFDAEDLGKQVMRQLSAAGIPRRLSPWVMTSDERWMNDVWQDPIDPDFRALPPSKTVTCSPVITLVGIEPPIVLVANRTALGSIVSAQGATSRSTVDQEIPGWLPMTLVARRGAPEGVSVMLPHAIRTGTRSPFDPTVKCFAVTETVTPLPIATIDEQHAVVKVPWGEIHLTRNADSWMASGSRTIRR